MNVNISYAVDLEKLPAEVKKLIVEVRQCFEGVVLDNFEKIENDFDDENYFRILKAILEVRRQLYGLDVRLQDCHGILSDYQRVTLLPDQEEVDDGQLAFEFDGEEGVENLENNEEDERG